MNQNDKCEMLKQAIERFYSKEGRSRVYISETLGLNRKILGLKISEWNLAEPKPATRLTPSNEKWLNKYKKAIISGFEHDLSQQEVADKLSIDFNKIRYFSKADEEIKNALSEKTNRDRLKHECAVSVKKEISSRVYGFESLEGEEWKPVLGYNDYFVSSFGRIKKYASTYDSYYLLSQSANINNERMYVTLINDNNERKNLQVARLVALSFCLNHSETSNTVNHKDGNVGNNKADNLEWVSQSDNNRHAYDKLNRPTNVGKRLDYAILYKGKYEFKTISAFAKFIGKSWTQASRWLDEPDKHSIKKIHKHNCNDYLKRVG